MLRIGTIRELVRWDAAGITLTLAPLTEDVHAQLIAETVKPVRDEAGKLTDLKRDPVAYDQGVGLACIKGWTGVVDGEGATLECTPEAIKDFMLIRPARDFVMDRVQGLALWLADEKDAAGNA